MIKTKKIRVILAILTVFGFSISGFANNPALITGIWDGRNINKVLLFKVDNGRLEEIASAKLNEKKEFGFAFNPDTPGFYVIGQSARSEGFNFAFYMAPGQKLSVAIQGASYELTGDNTAENREMERWHNVVKELENCSYRMASATYVEFFPMLDEVVEKAENYKVEYPVSDSFKEKFGSYRFFDLMYIAVKFLYMPNSAHPQEEDMTDYYNTMSLEAITKDEKLLDYPYGSNLLYQMRLHMSMKAAKKLPEESKKNFFSLYTSLDRDLPQIINERLKGETVLSATSTVKTFEGLQDLESKYGKYLINDDQKARFRNTMISIASNSRGQDAFDFKFKDVNGKEIALSDFKGKIVYVDVWATWCVPCRNELPFLKEIEKDYKGKNIVFIGVSTDVVKDYNKWVKFLKDYSMSGIQLFAGDKKDDIIKPYKITSIPRFLLFDKEGKIVSTSAPRPSSSEIRPLLDELLKK